MTSLGPWFDGGGQYACFEYEAWDPLGFWTGSSRRGDDRCRDDEVAATVNAYVDWRKTDKAHIFRADLPGVKKEDLKVQIEDGNVLEISGEGMKEEEEGTDKWHRVKRKRGSFVRRFRLPEGSNVDEIRCMLENGVLTVSVLKMEEERRRKDVRNIQVE